MVKAKKKEKDFWPHGRVLVLQPLYVRSSPKESESVIVRLIDLLKNAIYYVIAFSSIVGITFLKVPFIRIYDEFPS